LLDANCLRHGDVSYHIETALMAHFSKKPEVEKREKPKPVDENLEFYFDQFWESGIRKTGKKQAKSAFLKILKGKVQKREFTEYLIKDVQWRLSNNQLGFSEMHPTTYLRNERWTDERVQQRPATNGSQGLSSAEQSALILAQCEAEEAGNGFMASHGANVPWSMDQGRGQPDYGARAIDAEFSLVVQQDGGAN